MGDQASVYSRPSAPSIFGEDGKLSSASAATALKYAKPQDLPSYPSTGGVHMSSAGAAASLASSNHKSFEHWKPEAIPAANKAATLAKDYTMQPLWQPESTKAGSKAATTAHANPKEVEPMQPKRPATAKAPTPAYDTPANSRSKALMAANSVVNRQRAGSMPTQQPPKPREDSSWALKAATKSHKDGPSGASGPFTSGDPGFEAARIQNAAKDNATRQLYTSTPPVSIEVQEKNRQDTLKASAIAMARKMYAIQQQHLDEAAGKTKSGTRPRGSTAGDSRSASDDLNTNVSGYENLEEAARRLAQERLAKIHDEHAEYRNYYGAQPSPPSRSRLSVRLRRRASSNNRDDDSDEEQSRRIRSQMSIFQSKLAEVDSKKRQQDRDALLVIAHRNVDAQISKLDEKVFQETGKASPAQMEKWERAAREKAQRDSDERMLNTGKVHIGGGKYIDQSELDAIAKARLQPTLDDIADKAEKQRARDEEERLEKARKEQQLQSEKTRTAAIAAEARAAKEREKNEEKSRRDTEKRGQKEAAAAEKQRRRDTLAADRERERLEKEEQRERARLEVMGEDASTEDKPEKPGRLASLFSRGSSYKGETTAATATTSAAAAETVPEEEETADGSDKSRSDRGEDAEGDTYHDLATVTPDVSADAAAPILSNDSKVEETTVESPNADRSASNENRSSVDEEKEEATSPSKNRSRVKSWMRVRFRSKSGSQKDNGVMPVVAEQGEERKTTKEESEDVDAPVKDTSRPESMRDVAMAGRTSHESDDLYGPPRAVSPEGSKASKASKGSSKKKVSRDHTGSISSLSSHYSDETKDAKSEEATIEEAKVVEIKPQTSNEPAESDGDQRGRSGFKARLLRKITPNKTATKDDKGVTPVTSNATNDEFEEARDTFEEKKSEPLSTGAGEAQQGNGLEKTISPKASHERSRFTEDL